MSSSSWTAEDALVYVRECDRWSGIANSAGGLVTYCVACKIQDNSGSHFCSSKHARAVQNWGTYTRESFVHFRAQQGQAASEPNWILEQGKIMCAMPDEWALDSQAVRTSALSMHVTAPVLPVVDNLAHSRQVSLTQPVNVSQHVALTHPSMHVSQPATLTQHRMSELDAVFVRLAALEAGQEALKAQFERLSSAQTSGAGASGAGASGESAEKAASGAPRSKAAGFASRAALRVVPVVRKRTAHERTAHDSEPHQTPASKLPRAERAERRWRV